MFYSFISVNLYILIIPKSQHRQTNTKNTYAIIKPMNNDPTQPATAQTPEPTPKEPSVQPAEQNTQSDFPDPIAMAAHMAILPTTSAKSQCVLS